MCRSSGGSRKTNGKFAAANSRLMANASLSPQMSMATKRFICTISRLLTPQLFPSRKVVNEPAGGRSAFSEDGSRLLYNHNGPTAPGDLWVYHLATGKSEQLTHSLVAGIRSEDMVEPYLVHYPSRDGKWTISAFLYVPFNMARNGQNAAIVYIHGGPTRRRL